MNGKTNKPGKYESNKLILLYFVDFELLPGFIDLRLLRNCNSP